MCKDYYNWGPAWMPEIIREGVPCNMGLCMRVMMQSINSKKHKINDTFEVNKLLYRAVYMYYFTKFN
jgi:hypothetical protein